MITLINYFYMTTIRETLRIAHISDLHLCRIFKRKNISKLNALIKYALDNGAQHFVFTGDLFDNSGENEMRIFKQLLNWHNLLDSGKTSIVIGNHDIFGGPQTATDVITFPSRCSKVDYDERVQKFFHCFKELFEGAIIPDKNSPFPFAKEFKNVLLVGLNSIDIYSRFKNPFASNGHVNKEQRTFLEEILTTSKFKDKLKVIMIHHHFYKNDHATISSEKTFWTRLENYTMKLRGKKKLFKLFLDNNVKMILHGHSHEMNEYTRKGIRIVNAGGSMEEENGRMFIIDAFPFDIDVSMITVPVLTKKETDKSLIAVAV